MLDIIGSPRESSLSRESLPRPGSSDVDSIQANQQHETKYLTYYYDIDGSLVINARMPAEQGAQLIKALEAGTDLLFTEQRRVSAEARSEIFCHQQPDNQSLDVSA